MRRILAIALLACATLWIPTHVARAQRSDVFWARSTAGQHITLDGVLDESAWAKAESVLIQYRVDNGLPGSGWKEEGGIIAKDKTYAWAKFLVDGNQLYMGLTVRDSSIGGSVDFNRFDGLLMAIQDHAAGYHPAPPAEYFYAWWYPADTVYSKSTSALPGFAGRWGGGNPTLTRTPEQIANWDAVTRVHGIVNSDAAPDTGYTVEMRFNLAPMGYDVTQAGGDIVEFNISIYDVDWYWPINIQKFSGNRSWWQDPWGNDSWYGTVRMYSRPEVTINSGALPTVAPELVIPTANTASPVIDGKLNDPLWKVAPHFNIKYDDIALRSSYSGIGKWRSGQTQANVNANGGANNVLDPGDATVYYAFAGDTLYLGFDVRDQVVQYVAGNVDRWDGFIVSISDRTAKNPDHVSYPRRLTFQVGPTGQALKQDYLPYLADTLLGARIQLQLKGGTTVDTLGQQADSGYTAELAIDLTKLGYAHGLGDHLLFLGLTLLDGDSFTPFNYSYGTRTFWYQEFPGRSSPAWVYMDPNSTVGVDGGADKGARLALAGNYPNPFSRATTIRYSLPEPSVVSLKVYDVDGRRVASRELGLMPAGVQALPFAHPGLKQGMYFYRLEVTDPSTGARRNTQSGKMTVVN